MTDRRFAHRIVIHVPGQLYYHGQEIACTLYDISENGVRLRIAALESTEPFPFVLHDILTFQGIDSYAYIDGTTNNEVLQGEIEIVRIVKRKNYIEIGCKFVVPIPNLSDYITRKDILLFSQQRFPNTIQ